MGAYAEVFYDEKGLIWPEVVAPYQVHLVSLEGTEEKAKKVYEVLEKAGVEVLWDDRDEASAGVKFSDADLIGIPVRLVVSKKTGEKIEWKKRDSKKSQLLSLNEVLGRCGG